jgi:predicted ABC-type ATPase
MNVDRVPDGPDDPGRAAETARLTESPEPADAPRPDPEPEHPTPDRQPPPDQEPEPERQPDRVDPPGPPQADSPEPAEPRSRREHADSPSATDHAHQKEDDSDQEQEYTELLKYTDSVQDSKHVSFTEAAGNSANTSVELGRPLTDREHAEREIVVFDCLVKAHDEDLSTDFTYTTDPDRQQWTPQRDALHGQIVQDLYGRASEVPCEYKALIAGGLGGAGKTTILDQSTRIDTTRYLVINPDDIKQELAQRGLVPEVEGLTPMEASDLAHEESSVIAKQLARKAQSEGKNLIWDITMSSEKSTQRRIDDLRAAGYNQVDGLFVEIPIETSVRRMQLRHREGHDDYRAGIGLGGRFVPPEIIRSQADPEWGCKNRKTFEAMKQSLNNWEIHDNGTDGQPSRLIESSKREERY